jgi:hypothetical protein
VFSSKSTYIPSNISLHSNISNVTNTIGVMDTSSLLVLHRNNPNIYDCHYCINQSNCHKCASCFKSNDCSKCLKYTDHSDCDTNRANINVNSLPRYDDYISTVNNYFVPKTYKVNNFQNMNFYFLDEHGERINILSKKDGKNKQLIFKIDMDIIKEE